MKKRKAPFKRVSLWYSALAAFLVVILGVLVLDAMTVGAARSSNASPCARAALSQLSVPESCVRNAATLIDPTKKRATIYLLWTDNFFILVYVAWLILTALASIRTVLGTERFGFAAGSAIAATVLVSVSTGVADFTENISALHALASSTETYWTAQKIAVATTLKWQLLATSVVVVAGLAIAAAAAYVAARFRSQM